MLNLKQVQPEAKPLPDEHSLTLDDQVKRAPVPAQGTRPSENVSTPSMRRYAFSDKMKQHVSSDVSFKLKLFTLPNV